MHELTILVLHIIFSHHNILDADTVAALNIDTGLIGDIHTILKHCLHHTSGESPAHVLGTFVHIQNITYAVSGTALVINVHIPDRLSCQNVQIPSGTAVEPVGMGQLHHCRCYHGVMLFDLFGNGT